MKIVRYADRPDLLERRFEELSQRTLTIGAMPIVVNCPVL